jgi:hypothetical protein
LVETNEKDKQNSNGCFRVGMQRLELIEVLQKICENFKQNEETVQILVKPTIIEMILDVMERFPLSNILQVRADKFFKSLSKNSSSFLSLLMTSTFLSRINDMTVKYPFNGGGLRHGAMPIIH